MAKVKFNVKAVDKDTQVVYPVSADFVEVPAAFASRLKALQKASEFHKNSFEFQDGRTKEAKKEVKKEAK